MCTISVSPRQKFLKHSRVLKQAWGREGWEASVCVCVCLSLGVCTHIFVVGCFQTPSVTSKLPGSLGNSVTLFLNKRLQSLRKRLTPPAPPPLPPFSSAPCPTHHKILEPSPLPLSTPPPPSCPRPLPPPLSPNNNILFVRSDEFSDFSQMAPRRDAVGKLLVLLKANSRTLEVDFQVLRWE